MSAPTPPATPSAAAIRAAREITANCEHVYNIDGEFDTYVCAECVAKSLRAAYAIDAHPAPLTVERLAALLKEAPDFDTREWDDSVLRELAAWLLPRLTGERS